MGAVYRARDTKLHREVAIKVLLPTVANDVDRLARFQREAEVLASLNHPNIAHIHGLEEANGVTALVLELVEGPTLADRIATGPIPLDETLPIATQIAEALEAAHEQGIIHRDLKPANIKVRGDGVVKVLDFGLAKALETTGAMGASVSMSPIITSPALTAAGVILGTAAYMSPEQAKGRPADKRSDIWAFGCVIYEMLTGSRPFAGEGIAETLAAVLRGDPDWTRLPPGTPAALRRLLRRCLEKDRRGRLESAADARLEIGEAGATDTDGLAPAAALKKRSVSWALFAMSLAAVAASAGLIAWRVGHTGARQVSGTERAFRFQIMSPLGAALPGANGLPRFAVSPDGSRIAYDAVTTVNGESREQAWVQRLDGSEPQPISATSASTQQANLVQGFFWSPDGESLAYFDEPNGVLKRVNPEHGVAQTLCEVPGSQYGGSWSRDGVILVASLGTHGVQRVPSTGGLPTQVTTLDASRGETAHLWPQFLSDGRRFLFLATTVDPAKWAAYVGSLDGTPPIRLVGTTAGAVFAAPDRVLYVANGALVAQRIDVAHVMLLGDPIVVAENAPTTGQGRPGFSASDNGVLVFQENRQNNERYTIEWRDRSGAVLVLPSSAIPIHDPEVVLSRDNKRLAFTRLVERGSDVWTYDLGRRVASRVSVDADTNYGPVWNVDGDTLVYRSGGKKFGSLYQRAVSGLTPETVLQSPDADASFAAPLDWSPDGRFLLYAARAVRGPGYNLWLTPPTGDGKPTPYLQSQFDLPYAVFSPDGRFVAYTSNETGRYEVFVQTFPDPSLGRWPVSTAGGRQARWRGDGRELFYLDSQRRIVAVPVSTSPTLTIGSPSPLFTTGIYPTGRVGFKPFDVTADGQRFVLATQRTDVPGGALTVAVNWMADAKK